MQARHRHALVLLHRYTGLVLALYLVLMGLTGSLLAFHDEIDGWLNPQWQRDLPEGTALRPVDELVAIAEARYPHARVSFFATPPEGKAVAKVLLAARAPMDALPFDQLHIDAATGEVIGERNYLAASSLSLQELMPTLFQLHRNLLLGDLGKTVTGYVALVWLATLGVGIVLAWPKGGAKQAGTAPARWKKALGIKRGAGAFRTSYDLHRAIGLLAGALLLILALSGAVLNLYDLALKAVGTVSTVRPPPVSSDPAATRVGWQQAIDLARTAHPQAGLFGVARDPKRNTYQVRLAYPDDIQHSGRLRVFVDAADGTILRAHDPLKGSAGEAFLGLQFPLHSGQILGVSGQILMIFLGLMPLLFAVTGTVIWLQKRRSAAVSRQRGAKPARA